MTRAELQEFMNRDWGIFQRLRAEQLRRLSPAKCLEIAGALRQAVHASCSPRELARLRALDWKHHLELKRELDRASTAQRRR